VTAELTVTPEDSWGEQRSKVVSWHDPAPTTAAGLAMAGIDYLRAMVDGLYPPPPISGLMEFSMVSADPGRVVFTCRPDESLYNPIGVVHGGLVCTLLDSVAACALHSTLTATGTVVKSGSRVGFTEGVVTDPDGAVIATATSTLLVFDL
jgi:acyl-coenzyme A thioesterase PaaI-like protein